jgi:cytochrome c553
MWRRILLAGIGLVTLAGIAGYGYLSVTSPRTRTYRPPNDDIAIPTDAASIAHGKHLAEAVAICTFCHGDNLAGTLAFEDPVLGKAYTANLTKGRGGIGQRYSKADWIRSIRYGVRPDGTGILFMASYYYNNLTDADLGAIIAYAMSVPPVDNERNRVEMSLSTRLLIDAGVIGGMVQAEQIDFTAKRPPPPADPGAYIVSVAGCTFCHGPALTGAMGPETGAPPTPDLTVGGKLKDWSRADFAKALRTGVTPDGHTIPPQYMPWPGYRNMSDDDLRSVWDYLRSLPPARPTQAAR